MNDYIERQGAIDTHCAICPDKDKCPDVDFICPDRELFRMIKPAYPDLDESCEDCPVYDKEKHNCPRFCRVIPETIKELKQQKIGKWIAVDSFTAFGGDEATWEAHGNPVAYYYCSVCKEQCHVDEFGEFILSNYCPDCGAKMEEE